MPKRTKRVEAVPTFVRIHEEHYSRITAYEVFVGKRRIGFVWKYEGFSYRGMNGWNSGIRCRDFHPIEWAYGFTLGDSLGRYITTRERAANRLWEAAKGAK